MLAPARSRRHPAAPGSPCGFPADTGHMPRGALLAADQIRTSRIRTSVSGEWPRPTSSRWTRRRAGDFDPGLACSFGPGSSRAPRTAPSARPCARYDCTTLSSIGMSARRFGCSAFVIFEKPIPEISAKASKSCVSERHGIASSSSASDASGRSSARRARSGGGVRESRRSRRRRCARRRGSRASGRSRRRSRAASHARRIAGYASTNLTVTSSGSSISRPPRRTTLTSRRRAGTSRPRAARRRR